MDKDALQSKAADARAAEFALRTSLNTMLHNGYVSAVDHDRIEAKINQGLHRRLADILNEYLASADD